MRGNSENALNLQTTSGGGNEKHPNSLEARRICLLQFNGVAVMGKFSFARSAGKIFLLQGTCFTVIRKFSSASREVIFILQLACFPVSREEFFFYNARVLL